MAAAVALVGCGGGSSDERFLIEGDESIGAVPYDAAVRQAVEVFGTPGSRRGQYERCVLTWRSLGMTMETFYPLATKDPCGPEGRHLKTTVTDERWKTSAGLEMGDSLERLRERYPEARDEGDGVWWLTVKPIAGVELPALEAKLERGRVISFTLHGPREVF